MAFNNAITKGAVLFTLVLCLSCGVLGYTNSQIFTNLVEVKADLTSSYAIFDLNVPFNNIKAEKLSHYFVDSDKKKNINILGDEYYIEQTTEYEQPIYDNVKTELSCQADNGTYDCSTYENVIIDYETITKTEFIPLDPKFKFKKGVTNRIKVVANYKAELGERAIDWIPTINLDKKYNRPAWAWWNSSWTYKKQVNFTANNGNFTTFKVTYDSDMQVDFDDLRFVNNAEDTSLNYTIRKKVNSSFALVTVHSLGESSIYMYYDNDAVSTTGSTADLYFSPTSYFYFDDDLLDKIGSNDITNNGAVSQTGQINESYEYDGGDDYATRSSFADISDTKTYSINLWIKPDVINDFDVFLAQAHDTGDRLAMELINSEIRVRTYTPDVTVGGAYPNALNVWSMITLIHYSNDTMTLKVDGNTITGGSEVVTTQADDAFSLGASNTFSGFFYNGELDEFAVYDNALTQEQIMYLYTSTEPTTSFGVEICSNQDPIITINAPEAEYYYNTTVPVEIVVSDDLTGLSCSILEDDILIYTTTNNETYSANRVYTAGEHNLSVNCTDASAATALDSVIFNIGTFLELNTYWTDPAFGGKPENITADFIYNPDLITNITLIDETAQRYAEWNIDDYKIYYEDLSTSTNGTTANLTISDLWRVRSTNTSGVTSPVSLEYTVYYINGTAATTTNWVVTGSNVSTPYALNADSYSSSVLEGTSFNYDFYIQKLHNEIPVGLINTSAIVTYNGTEYAATELSENATYFTYRWTHTAEDVSGTEDINITAKMTFYDYMLLNEPSFNDYFWINSTFTTRTITIAEPSLIACNVLLSNETALNFTIRDEETGALVIGDLDSTFTIYSQDRSLSSVYSFNETGASYYEYCIYPVTSSGLIDSFQIYSATGYSQRSWFLDNTSLTNSTATYDLYLLNSSNAVSLKMTVENKEKDPVEDAIVFIEKYNPGDDTYITVGMLKTDEDGVGWSVVDANEVYYRFVVYLDFIHRLTTGEKQLVDENADGIIEQFLVIDPGVLYNTILERGLLDSECSFNNLTNNLTCDYNDDSGDLDSACFSVDVYTTEGWVSVCEECSALGAYDFVCDLGENATNETHRYTVTGYAPDSFTINSGLLDFADPITDITLGQEGVLLALFLVLTLSLVGIWNPVAALVLAGAGLILSVWTGLLVVTYGALASIVAVIIILIFRVRS